MEEMGRGFLWQPLLVRNYALKWMMEYTISDIIFIMNVETGAAASKACPYGSTRKTRSRYVRQP